MKHRAALVLFLLAAAARADVGLPPAQQALVAAERAFVVAARERGFRDSFYEYFAEDGIGFAPHPVRMRLLLKNQPPTPPPMGAAWAPVWGDVSRAGDLGWNTGPLVFEGRGGAPDRHGLFFSVWKLQPDGEWKVVLDVGTDTPQAVVPLDAPFETSWHEAPAPAAPADGGVESLLAVERELLAVAEEHGLGRALAARLSDAARVHRPGVMPVTGREALTAWADAQRGKLRGEAQGADVARSGDLGYAWGSFEAEDGNSGYWARVWKRSAEGDWRVVFDTASPLPAGARPLTAELRRAEEDFLSERWAPAEAAYASHVAAHPDDSPAWSRLGTIQLRQQRYAEAIASLERAAAAGRPADLYNLACAHALAGHAEQALDYVEKTIAAGLRNPAQYEADPDLAGLRELPRFRTLMQSLE